MCAQHVHHVVSFSDGHPALLDMHDAGESVQLFDWSCAVGKQEQEPSMPSRLIHEVWAFLRKLAQYQMLSQPITGLTHTQADAFHE